MKASFAIALAATVGVLASEIHPSTSDVKSPNIVVILVDDQDLLLKSMDYMPFVKENITSHGTTFNRHFCSTALCCPSRVTLWTGRYAHNTNVTDVGGDWGKDYHHP
jgi:arylsulfatase A-like enzyme